MKSFLTSVALLLVASTSSAFLEINPEELCDVGCTKKMSEIQADFRAKGTAANLNEAPLAASGACYHIDSSLDPEHEHHGLTLIENTSDGPRFQALFSFFAESNPWIGLNVDQIRAALTEGGSKPKVVENREKEHHIIAYQGSDAYIEYWVRADQASNEVYLLSSWQFTGHTPKFIFCRLKR